MVEVPKKMTTKKVQKQANNVDPQVATATTKSYPNNIQKTAQQNKQPANNPKVFGLFNSSCYSIV